MCAVVLSADTMSLTDGQISDLHKALLFPRKRNPTLPNISECLGARPAVVQIGDNIGCLPLYGRT